jgi:hypothetical protein
VQDTIASYETLVNIFERTQFSLQRLNHYITASLTPDMAELLANVLAKVLSVLALSMKEMKERRVRKTEVEDGLQQLDILTTEENLLTAARTLGITSDIRHNDAEVIEEDTRGIKEDTRNISDNLEVNKRGASYLSTSSHSYQSFPVIFRTAIDGLQRLYLPVAYHH